MSSPSLTREARTADDATAESELTLREELSTVRGLLALSLLMTERRHEHEILHLARTATPALVDCDLVSVHLDGIGWHGGPPADDPATGVRVRQQLRGLPPTGGAVDAGGTSWAWACPLHGLEGNVGHLLVVNHEPLSPDKIPLLRSLAQQTGIAIANARLHADHATANAALADTVATLEHKNRIHDRFTAVALNLEGYAGIVRALFELTGLPAVIEDDRGNVLGRAGPETAPPTRALSAAAPADLAHRALRSGRPIQEEDRLLTAARPRSDLLALIYLIGAESVIGEQETMALEHAATVLAMELARLHSIAETELRLGVDLVAALLGGADDGVGARARALGHDLGLPHRVVVLRTAGAGQAPDLVAEIRAALPGRRLLLMPRGDTVVAIVVAPDDGSVRPADRLPAALLSLIERRRLHAGVGSLCRAPDDYPRSHREAELSLGLAAAGEGRNGVVTYDDLGVYQFLSEATDPQGVDAFVRRWLGRLLDYDEQRGGDLVLTLARFLDTGGGYDTTARSLGLGRSTVRYRIGRACELTGLDITDADTRFQLHLATRAWTTLRALAAVPRVEGPTAPRPRGIST